MSDERLKIIRDGVIDVVAIGCLSTLVFLGRLDGGTGGLYIVGVSAGTLVTRLITSFLGARLAGQVAGVSLRPPPAPPPASLVFLLAGVWLPLWEAARVFLVVALTFVLAATLSSCGASSPEHPSTLCRVARGAQAACLMVDRAAEDMCSDEESPPPADELDVPEVGSTP